MREWDPETKQYKVVDYSKFTEEQIIQRIDSAFSKNAEFRRAVAELLPAAEAQKILNAKSIDAYELIIKLIKRAPEIISKVF